MRVPTRRYLQISKAYTPIDTITAHNLKPEPQTIDIHRLNVNEAVAEVKRALREARSSGSPEVRVITGRGKHSKNQIPVLKKALIQKMLE